MGTASCPVAFCRATNPWVIAQSNGADELRAERLTREDLFQAGK